MKKRIPAMFLLSCMMVSFVAPFMRQKEKAKYNLAQETIAIKEQLPPCNDPARKISTKEIKNETDTAFEEMNNKMQAIIQDYSDAFDPPETIYDYYTDEELALFFRVVQAEVGDEYTFEQKANVASVIINRLNHNQFGESMFEVLTPDQFETIHNKRYKKSESFPKHHFSL